MQFFEFNKIRCQLCLSIFVLMSLSVLALDAKDGSPVFYLKIAKSIPRVGRSGNYEDFYLKASKNIPRIGRNEPQLAVFTKDNDWPLMEDADTFVESTKRLIENIQ